MRVRMVGVASRYPDQNGNSSVCLIAVGHTVGKIGRSGENSVLEVDPKRCGRLLARKLPAVIRTEAENERLIAELEELEQRHDELTPEEREYSELLTVLIEAFEDANY